MDLLVCASTVTCGTVFEHETSIQCGTGLRPGVIETRLYETHDIKPLTACCGVPG